MTKIALSLFAVASLLSACTSSSHDSQPDGATGPASIVATAQASSSLSTLVAAVEFASNDGDLVNLLSDPGTLTVFAPSNDAFDSLAVELTGNSSATGADLLTAANKSLLRSVLQYHVLTKAVYADQIPFGHAIQTAEGDVFKIDMGTPPVITDGRNRTAHITQTNIAATNGVIHLIDHVLLPPDMTIVQTAQALATSSQPQFTVLVQAVTAANLAGTLNGSGPFTLFAPTDAAFASLLSELGETQDQLLADTSLLTSVLEYHVLPARDFKADLPIGTPITTVETGTFTVDANLTITDARGRTSNITATDTLASNGVIHVIDTVLLPAAQ